MGSDPAAAFASSKAVTPDSPQGRDLGGVGRAPLAGLATRQTLLSAPPNFAAEHIRQHLD